MWFTGYLGRLPGVGAPPAVLFALFIAFLLLGGGIAGRISARGWRAGLWAGSLTGAINLLILGSLLGGKNPLVVSGDIIKAAALWGPACIVISGLLGGVGAIA